MKTAKLIVMLGLMFTLGALLYVPGVASAEEPEITDDTLLNCYDYRVEPAIHWQIYGREIQPVIVLIGYDLFMSEVCLGDGHCFTDSEVSESAAFCEPEPGPPKPTTETGDLEISYAF